MFEALFYSSFEGDGFLSNRSEDGGCCAIYALKNHTTSPRSLAYTRSVSHAYADRQASKGVFFIIVISTGGRNLKICFKDFDLNIQVKWD
ncbi:MAG TPA: hypothetical protein DCX27_09985 [Balneola sp.]|nr:hypothetical protein [Balneola sp.]